MSNEKVTFQNNGEYTIGVPINEMDVKKDKGVNDASPSEKPTGRVVSGGSVESAPKSTMKKFSLSNLKKNAVGYTESAAKMEVTSTESATPNATSTEAAKATVNEAPVKADTVPSENVSEEKKMNTENITTPAEEKVVEDVAAVAPVEEPIVENVEEAAVVTEPEVVAVESTAAEEVVEEPVQETGINAYPGEVTDAAKVEVAEPATTEVGVAATEKDVAVEDEVPVSESGSAVATVDVEVAAEEVGGTVAAEEPVATASAVVETAKTEKKPAFNLGRLGVNAQRETSETATSTKMDLMGLNETKAPEETPAVPELTTDEKAPFIFHSLEEFLKLTNLDRTEVSNFIRAVVKSAHRGNAIWSKGETPLRAYACISGTGGARNYIIPLGWDVHVTACYVSENYSLTDGSIKLKCVDNCAFISGTPVALSAERNRPAKVL